MASNSCTFFSCGARAVVFFFSSRRRHTICSRDWSSDVCSSDLAGRAECSRVAKPKQQVAVTEIRASGGERGGSGEGIRAIDMQVCVVHLLGEKIGRASCRESVDLGGRRIIKKKKRN